MDRIIVSNNAQLEQLGRHRGKGVVLTGGVSASLIPAAAEARSDASGRDKIIVMTGRVEAATKGLDVLLKAGELLAQRRRDFQIWATHFDPRESREHYVAAGWLSHEETMRLYGQADIAVVPSLWQEPFGLVAVEAMAAGLPVCASDTGGLRDIVVHDETGFLFPPGDAETLASRLEVLLDSGALRNRLGQAGRARVLSRFTWDAVIENQYLPLLESLCP